MQLFIERQNELVICKLKADDTWFFSACYRGVKELLGFEFSSGSKFELDLVVKSVKEIPTDGR